MLQFIVKKILRPKWVVFTDANDANPELGLQIFGVIVGLYKADAIFYSAKDFTIRNPDKREFGESLRPLKS